METLLYLIYEGERREESTGVHRGKEVSRLPLSSQRPNKRPLWSDESVRWELFLPSLLQSLRLVHQEKLVMKMLIDAMCKWQLS